MCSILQIVSDSSKLKTIDLYKVNKADLVTFDSMFRLTTDNHSEIAALFVYFRIMFGACHLPLEISSAPYAPTIRWKPMVCMLPPTSVCRYIDEKEVLGMFRFVSHANDTFEFHFELCISREDGEFRETLQYTLK